MRLSDRDRQTILDAVTEQYGDQAEVKLFGSRLDDSALGGDIDLLISLNYPATEPTISAARLNSRLHRLLGGRKVDLLLRAPNLPERPIHQIADNEGECL